MVESKKSSVIDIQSFKERVEDLHSPEHVTETEFLRIAELIYGLVLALDQANETHQNFDDEYDREMGRINDEYPWTRQSYLVTKYSYFVAIALTAQGKEVKAPLTGTGWTGKNRQKAG